MAGKLRILQDLCYRLSQCGRVARRYEPACDAVQYRLPRAADLCADHRPSGGLRLECDKR